MKVSLDPNELKEDQVQVCYASVNSLRHTLELCRCFNLDAFRISPALRQFKLA